MDNPGLTDVAVNHRSKFKNRLHEFTQDVWNDIMFWVKVDDWAKLHILEYFEEYSSNCQSMNQ